jgi:hypothetical protein
MSSVIWHDVECASYVEDLPLWRSLADEYPWISPAPDIGSQRSTEIQSSSRPSNVAWEERGNYCPLRPK